MGIVISPLKRRGIGCSVDVKNARSRTSASQYNTNADSSNTSFFMLMCEFGTVEANVGDVRNLNYFRFIRPLVRPFNRWGGPRVSLYVMAKRIFLPLPRMELRSPNSWPATLPLTSTGFKCRCLFSG